ncbi:MAG: prepilin-type N-terminal cleavage/methylation domain-containing protein [Patescibacteria group bacterium]
MPTYTKFQRGFSLVEMISYIAILVLMLGIITNTIIAVVHSGRAIKSLKNVETSAIISMERLTRELRQAESVNVSSSVLDSNPGRLILEGKDDAGAPRTVEFYLLDNQLFYKENGIDIGTLSQSDTRVTNLVFRLFPGLDSMGVRTEMTIESGTSTHYRSENYYLSALIR